jgi:hypothetical protein
MQCLLLFLFASHSEVSRLSLVERERLLVVLVLPSVLLRLLPPPSYIDFR